MPDLSIEALTGALALATVLLVFVTGLLAVANWRAASAAKRSADAVVREFRLTRRPRLTVKWEARRAIGQAPVHVFGVLRETAHVPTVIDAVDACVTRVGAAESAAESTRGLEVRGPGAMEISGTTLCGPETCARFGMMFEAAPALLAGQPLAILTVDITASVEDIREIRRYYLDVDGGRSGSPAVSVLDIVIRPSQARGEQEQGSVVDALCRAWRGGVGWGRPGTAERAARQATGASGRTAREIQNRDTATLPETLIMAAEQVELVQPDGPGVEEVVADKGYHSDETLVALGAVGVRSHVSEPERGRRCWQDKKTGETPPEKRAAQKALYANRRRVRGRRGRRLQRCRGEVVERSFAHLYETGGMRRVWVRGHENVRKRVLIQAAACNIGLLLRRLTGVGTPRSLQGRAVSAICRLIGRLIDRWGRLTRAWGFKWTPTALVGSIAHRQAA